jgi:hypothetical protein
MEKITCISKDLCEKSDGKPGPTLVLKTRVYEKSELQECDLGLVATTEAVLYLFSNCVKYVEKRGLRVIETQCAERMPYFPPHKMTLERGGGQSSIVNYPLIKTGSPVTHFHR